MKTNQKGFSVVEILVVILVVVLIGGIGWYVWQAKQNPSVTTTQTTTNTTTTPPNPTNNSTAQPCNCPASLPPNGPAGGDLLYQYPNPMVRAIMGHPLSYTPPAIGQILRWVNGAWTPSDDMVGNTEPASMAGGIQTYFKLDNTQNSPQAILDDNLPERNLSALSITFSVTKKSRLVISAGVTLQGPFCPLGCTDGEGWLIIHHNSASAPHSAISFRSGWSNVSAGISNYMMDVNPGTHVIDFFAHHLHGKSEIRVYGEYSSLMVIPLE